MISDNPSVQEFRQVVTKQNEALVYKKRMMVLEKGAKFPKLPAQKAAYKSLKGFSNFSRSVPSFREEKVATFLLELPNTTGRCIGATLINSYTI